VGSPASSTSTWNLATGDLHVHTEGPLDPSAVAAAVEEAGYELAGVPAG